MRAETAEVVVLNLEVLAEENENLRCEVELRRRGDAAYARREREGEMERVARVFINEDKLLLSFL